jgi:hypothetical protein
MRLQPFVNAEFKRDNRKFKRDNGDNNYTDDRFIHRRTKRKGDANGDCVAIGGNRQCDVLRWVDFARQRNAQFRDYDALCEFQYNGDSLAHRCLRRQHGICGQHIRRR